MVCTDYSKAFDTVQFKAVLTKMHGMGFSHAFLQWMANYLTDRKQLVQIDDKSSETATVKFGVPQGSILGPFIFNLYVADLQVALNCPCYQYANDTTFYRHSKPTDLNSCVKNINQDLSQLGEYSQRSNLALNAPKTKWMLVSTRQMSRVHHLQNFKEQVSCNNTHLERVAKTKLLGLLMDENLSWDEQVSSLLSSCYGVLSILRKLKKMAPYHVRKLLAECLVLSKLDYAAAVFYPLPLYQLKRLQRVQNACAGFVLGRYANENDLHTLNWLPMSKRRDFIVLKLVFKALHDKNWPSYLALEKCEVGKYNLRSMGATTLKVPRLVGTFQETSAQLFNKLPPEIRETHDFNAYCRLIKAHLTS